VLRGRRSVKKRLVLASLLLACVGTAALAAREGVLLPTEWSLEPPHDRVVSTGTLPQGAALTADGTHLIVVEDGEADGDVRIFAANSFALERIVPLEGAAGPPLPDPAGDGFWVGLGAQDALAHVDAATGAIDRTIALPEPFWASDIVRSPDGTTLAVSGDLADAVVLVDAASGAVGTRIRVGRHPSGLAFSADGKTLFVANWAESSVSVIDVAGRRETAQIAVGLHPEILLLSRDAKTLYVSETDDDSIGAIDVVTQRRTSGVNVGPYLGKVYGASPTALALSPDGSRLFVTDAAANAVAVVDTSGASPRLAGAIPVGWYPTALVLEPGGAALDVIDGKGESSRPNPQFDPFGRGAHARNGYVAASEIGSVRRVALGDAASLMRGLAKVRAHAGPGLATALAHASPPATTSLVRSHGPLRHVIYVVKENRTYDQVLGDLPRGDGDPKLTLFGANVTPNQHALAMRFGVLDNTFADAEVSADGHNWSMAAFANDYLERFWPPNYGSRRNAYDFEDGAEGSTPHAGYLWNAALRAGISTRNYGEFTTELSMKPQPRIISHMAGLAAVTDSAYPGFDLAFSDEDREAEWAREFAGYVANRNLPQLEIVRLPNDHTAGTAPNRLTPSAYVAQNDLAVGRLVDTVSHSRYWRDTAIFIVEDDAQNGPDHVDDQRMPAYAISAYAPGGVLHVHHSTAGVVRTIELLLGLAPMSSYDAAARPLDEAFAGKADLRPFEVLPETTDRTLKNGATAYRAGESARLDFSREDAVAEGTLNDLIWHAVRGAKAPIPPYGAFPGRD
jgi:YVTN family beta-propeller protein